MSLVDSLQSTVDSRVPLFRRPASRATVRCGLSTVDCGLLPHFFSASTYSVSMTSSSLPEGAEGPPVDDPAPGPEEPWACDAAVRYIASAILWEACCSRSAAAFMLAALP